MQHGRRLIAPHEANSDSRVPFAYQIANQLLRMLKSVKLPLGQRVNVNLFVASVSLRGEKDVSMRFWVIRSQTDSVGAQAGLEKE